MVCAEKHPPAFTPRKRSEREEGGGDDKKPKTACFADTQGWQSLFLSFPGRAPTNESRSGMNRLMGLRGTLLYIFF